MKITKSQLKQIITEEMEYVRLIEEVEQDATEKYAALERGMEIAKEAFTNAGPEKVKEVFKTAIENQGFIDPCVYVKKNEAQLRKEFETMQAAQEAVIRKQEILERVTNWGKIMGTLSVAPFAMGLVQGLYDLVVVGASDMVARLPFVDSGLDPAAVAGLGTDQWLLMGKLMFLTGILLMIYRYLLGSGLACTIKDFLVDVSKVVKVAVAFAARVVGNLLGAFGRWIRSLWSRSRGSTEETPTDAGPWQPVTEGYKYSTSISLLKEWKLINSAVSDSLNHLQTTGVLA